MKTQLLEDIGQSTTSSLTPPKAAGTAKAAKEGQDLAPAGNAQPARPRSASGVWRQKPLDEPLISMTQHPVEAPPLELDKVFEEIAALEAQFVPPGQQHEPGTAAAESRQAPPAPPAGSLHQPDIPPAESLHRPGIPPIESLHRPDIPPAEARPAPEPPRPAMAPQEPRFDFTPPPQARQAADPFTPAPARSRQRYLAWTACLFAGALLILGGRWLYQERNDARSLALIADEAKEESRGAQVDTAAKPPAMAAQGTMPEPDADARVAPAIPASRPSPGVPPLVMLEPDPPAAKPEQPSPPPADKAEPPVSPAPKVVKKQETAAPLPKPSSRTADARSDAAARPAKERAKREPVRQLARASATGKERPSGRDTSNAAARPAKERVKREPVRQLARASATAKERPTVQDTSMAATLKACREHGYHATQCIKQDCSLTQYGFVCRGR